MNKSINTDLPEAHRFSAGDEVVTTGGLHAVVESTDGENVNFRTRDGYTITGSAYALWHAGKH